MDDPARDAKPPPVAEFQTGCVVPKTRLMPTIAVSPLRTNEERRSRKLGDRICGIWPRSDGAELVGRGLLRERTGPRRFGFGSAGIGLTHAPRAWPGRPCPHRGKIANRTCSGNNSPCSVPVPVRNSPALAPMNCGGGSPAKACSESMPPISRHDRDEVAAVLPVLSSAEGASPRAPRGRSCTAASRIILRDAPRRAALRMRVEAARHASGQ